MKRRRRTNKPKLRRSWPQRSAIGLLVVASIACFFGAGSLTAGQWVLSQRHFVEMAQPSDLLVDTRTTGLDGTADVPAEQIELVEPDAANFLVTGADNNDCADPDAIDDRPNSRSDTIMVWRVNPETDELAVLSFPRDLYVDRPGGFRSRINAAYTANDPSELVDTIYLNFGIPIDHYVQVDFCAFRTLVDAVGGVAVPFEFPTRDVNTGLVILQPGCVELDGSQALKYVRSRQFQYLEIDEDGDETWRKDPSFDLGRVSRQQDFARRLIAKVIRQGLYSPSAATALIETNREHLVTDRGLTPQRILEFANTLRSIDSNDIPSYQIESYPDTVSGKSIQRMAIEGEEMQAILALFRGQARLSQAPDQSFADLDTAAATVPTTESTVATDGAASGDDQTTAAEATEATVPSATPDQDVIGIVPDATVSCSQLDRP